ncbi:hypothetical protein D018_3536B, partial [Vibrio parahaemolyticus VP2007-007]
GCLYRLVWFRRFHSQKEQERSLKEVFLFYSLG